MKQFFLLIFCTLLLCSCGGYVVVSGFNDAEAACFGQNAERELTVVVYLAADNNLESAALEDMNEMEAAVINPSVTVLALIDRSPGYDASDGNWSGTRLYEIVHDADGMNRVLCSKRLDCPELGLYKNRDTELNMSSEYTLSGVLSFAKENYPANQYGLVMWGHGTGWRSRNSCSDLETTEQTVRAFAIDDTGNSYLALSKLRNAIELGMNETKLSFVGFDTCFGFEFEVAYELKNCALWLCGCEGVEANSGWNYTRWLNSLSYDVPDGKTICLNVAQQFALSSDWSFGIADLTKIQNAFACFDGFAQLCASCISTKAEQQKLHTCFNQAQSFSASGTESDLYVNVCDLIKCMTQQFPQINESGLYALNALQNALYTVNKGTHVAMGVYVCDTDNEGKWQLSAQNAYTHESKNAAQCAFVCDSTGYVPSVSGSTSLLDKLFSVKM